MSAETEALILAKLDTLTAKVDALLERNGGRRTKNAEPDAEKVAALLHAIIKTERRDSRFGSADLVDHAQLLEPDCVALRAAIIDAVGVLNVHKLSSLFSKIAGMSYGGLSVHRVGSESNTARWALKEGC